MKIGIDLDNTIIDYSGIFYRVAVEKGWVPVNIDQAKNSVRGYLQDRDQNDVWTVLQGLVYAPYLNYARPYDGVVEFIKESKAAGHTVKIISHKTRVAAMGEKYDLRAAATEWLRLNEIAGSEKSPLGTNDVAYTETREEKVDMIVAAGCEIFIDDLPEVFAEPHFPASCQRILFDGVGTTWPQISAEILGPHG